MDFAICNGLGIWCGIKTCEYLEMKNYHWRSLYKTPTIRSDFFYCIDLYIYCISLFSLLEASYIELSVSSHHTHGLRINGAILRASLVLFLLFA